MTQTNIEYEKSGRTGLERDDVMSNLLPVFVRAYARPSVPLAFVGDPGCGKTAQWEEIARRFNLPIRILLLSTMTPDDVGGLWLHSIDPNTGKDIVRQVSPSWYKDVAQGSCILFLDEFNTASKEVTDAFLTIIQSRRMPNGDQLSEKCVIVAAMNAADQCNNAELSPATVNRFAWFDIKPSLAEFQRFYAGDSQAEFEAISLDNISVMTLPEYMEWIWKSEDNDADKKELLYRMIAASIDVTPSSRFEPDKQSLTYRSMLNWLYWSNDAAEAIETAGAFFDDETVKKIKTINMSGLNSIANTLFSGRKNRNSAAESRKIDATREALEHVQERIAASDTTEHVRKPVAASDATEHGHERFIASEILEHCEKRTARENLLSLRQRIEAIVAGDP